ncbi:MAG TPA: hypothetical protein VFT72_14305 [Opitutaceae bacterium]|nr:hypothetical protein [Opitutaceae bacterium]
MRAAAKSVMVSRETLGQGKSPLLVIGAHEKPPHIERPANVSFHHV